MHYGRIKTRDIANGEGVRVVLFVSGCRNKCKGCFQPETWSFAHGSEFTKETEDEIIDALKEGYIQGLTVLGGDPFEPENQRDIFPFIKRVRETYPTKDIWMYSGYTYEELTGSNPHCAIEVTKDILSLIDILVDGRYDESLRNPSLQFRGSSNQRIIDVQKTLANNEITLWERLK